jgi:hypothetical protein
MIEDRKERINYYGRALYPIVKPKDYDIVSELIDKTIDYLNSKQLFLNRSSNEKALGVFFIKKLWESYDKFKKNKINEYLNDFYGHYDNNYDRYLKELIITSADDSDLLLSFAIEYINENYGKD